MNFENRQSSNPNRRKLKIVSQSANEMVVDMERAEGTVQTEGTPIEAGVFNAWETRVSAAETKAEQSRENCEQAKRQIESYTANITAGAGSVVTQGSKKVLTFDADTKVDKSSVVVSANEPSNAQNYQDGTVWIQKKPDNTVKLWTKKTEVLSLPLTKMYGDVLAIGALSSNQVTFPIPEVVNGTNEETERPAYDMVDTSQFNGYDGVKLYIDNYPVGEDYSFSGQTAVYSTPENKQVLARENVVVGASSAEPLTACRIAIDSNTPDYTKVMALKFAENEDNRNHPFYFSLDNVYPGTFMGKTLMEHLLNNNDLVFRVVSESEGYEETIPLEFFKIKDIPGVGRSLAIEVDDYMPEEVIRPITVLLAGSLSEAMDVNLFNVFSNTFTIFFAPFGEWKAETQVIQKFE